MYRRSYWLKYEVAKIRKWNWEVNYWCREKVDYLFGLMVTKEVAKIGNGTGKLITGGIVQ